MDLYSADDVFPDQDRVFARANGDRRRLRLPPVLATVLRTSAIVVSAAIGRAIGG